MTSPFLAICAIMMPNVDHPELCEPPRGISSLRAGQPYNVVTL